MQQAGSCDRGDPLHAPSTPVYARHAICYVVGREDGAPPLTGADAMTLEEALAEVQATQVSTLAAIEAERAKLLARKAKPST